MLERVYIDNYRCLVNFECRFGTKQLILGPNGGGKTTLFNVLSALRDFSAHGSPAENFFVGTTKTRWQEEKVPEQTFELDVQGNGGSYTFRLVLDTWGRPVSRPRVVKEEVFFSGKPIFRFAHGDVHLFNDQFEEKVKYPFDWFRSALATITERPENKKLSWFKRWLGNILFISPDPHQMGALAQKEDYGPTPNLSNFASWFRHLRLESDDQDLLADLRAAIPGLESMDLKTAGMGNYVLILSFLSDDENGHPRRPLYYNLHEISDGQRVLLGLYTVLHYAVKPGALVMFDEPDNFVALSEIQPWLDKVIERVEDDEESSTQVIFASHHPELLNRLAFAGGVEFDRPNGRHTRVSHFADVAQTGLSPAELVARGWEHE